MLCDFRSDTVTKPTPGMREAMMAADIGDDVFGEDASANRLEQTVAELLGKEAALFVPSGTMANQLAIHLHCRPGDSILLEEDSHCFIYEGGGGAALSGVQFDVVPYSENMSDAALKKRFRAPGLMSAATKLLVVENTHNRQGGEARSPAQIEAIARTGRSLGVKLHCDGARIWNAAVRFDCDEKALAAPFDTVAVCFSKGLGAPVGSALVGPRDFIQEARRIRKRWGGGMRQVGFLAAAALFGIRNHRKRMALDHEMAAELKDGLEKLGKQNGRLKVRALREPTNMLYIETPAGKGDWVVERAKKDGVLFFHQGAEQLRLVTHLDLPPNAVRRTLDVFTKILGEMG